MNNIKGYVGFAKKMMAVEIGVDNIESSRKHIKVILYSSILADKSKKRLLSRENIPAFEIEDSEFADIISNDSIKAIAICNKSLGNIIIKNLN